MYPKNGYIAMYAIFAYMDSQGMCIYVYVYIYMYVYIYIYVYMRMCIYIYMVSFVGPSLLVMLGMRSHLHRHHRGCVVGRLTSHCKGPCKRGGVRRFISKGVLIAIVKFPCGDAKHVGMHDAVDDFKFRIWM